jgi:hypothetical protein
MSRRPELSLDDELMVRKGEARGIAPIAGVAEPTPAESRPPRVPFQSRPIPEVTSQTPTEAAEERPVVVGRRRTIERVYTNVRIPKDLDERLFRMVVETRRTKQDIIETFIKDGLDRHETGDR